MNVTLKMVTAIFAETLGNTQHSTLLTLGRHSYTLNFSARNLSRRICNFINVLKHYLLCRQHKPEDDVFFWVLEPCVSILRFLRNAAIYRRVYMVQTPRKTVPSFSQPWKPQISQKWIITVQLLKNLLTQVYNQGNEEGSKHLWKVW